MLADSEKFAGVYGTRRLVAARVWKGSQVSYGLRTSYRFHFDLLEIIIPVIHLIDYSFHAEAIVSLCTRGGSLRSGQELAGNTP